MLLEICLEEEDLTLDERFIRCVALPGDQPGLALDRAGAVRWMPAEPADYGLWVSADDQLILLRAEAAGPIMVRRAGRCLEAPAARPVVLRDQDLLEVGGRTLRVHLHGATDQIYPPERTSASVLSRMASAAAALALSAALGLGGNAVAEPRAPAPAPEPIQVRPRPPAPMPTTRPVDCEVTAITASKAGPVMVQARCPKKEKIGVGLVGHLLDAAGTYLKDGAVTVTRVDGDRIQGTSQLAKPIKAPKLRFRLPLHEPGM